MIILRQQEYTSLPRKIGAKLKRTRVNLANSVGRKLRTEAYLRDAISEELNNYSIQNPRILKESIREGRNECNARTLRTEQFPNLRGSSNVSNNKIMKSLRQSNATLEDLDGKLGNEVKKGKNIIFLSSEDTKGNKRGYDIAEHAHEVGHLKNNNSISKNNQEYHKLDPSKRWKSILTAKNLKRMEKSGARKKILDSPKDSTMIDKGIGLKEYFKRVKEGRIVVREERDASKHAIKFLKDHNANSSELKAAKEKLGKALNTYKSQARIHRRLPLQNMLQIDSRRRK